MAIRMITTTIMHMTTRITIMIMGTIMGMNITIITTMGMTTRMAISITVRDRRVARCPA